MDEARSFLVLWQTAEAESLLGDTPDGGVGTHMKGLSKGDIIVVCSSDDSELFLLGAMKVNALGTESRVRYRGKPMIKGRSLAVAFQMLPLGPLKWKLRFAKTDFPKLSRSKSLLW